MDPPPPQPPASSPAAASPAKKLRLMCSYGGHITQRPQTKSLHYAGGETRLISIPDSSNLTLSALVSRLSSTLHLANYPFILKYQLPDHDLESLISISTDEDLLVMLDEHRRLARSPSRIRLFIFPVKSASSPPDSTQFGANFGNELRHPMTETWFADVLKSTKLMQRGGAAFGGDGQAEGNCGGGEVGGVLCGAESMVLETTSSLGSSGSAMSLFPNFPAKGHSEDHSVKLPPSDAIASDNAAPIAISNPQIGAYQEPVPAHVLESETKTFDPQMGVDMHRGFHHSGFPIPFQYDQPQQVQFIQTAPPHYVPQNPAGITPMPSFYYAPMPQQQMYYPANQPPPVYCVPVANPYDSSMQTRFNRPPVHPYPSPNHQMATTQVNLPLDANRQFIGVDHQAQSTETANARNETDDDDAVVRSQIYKSQPPAPSQYQTMTKATAGVMLSEALAQLHVENAKQQPKSSQP